MNNKNVLIVGAGIAGPTLAWWLERYGFTATVVECASAPRKGGYMLDFWGLGFTVAERMGLLPALRESAYRIESVRYVNAAGKRVGNLSWQAVATVLEDRFFSLLRYDLAMAIYEQARQRLAFRFGESIYSIEQDDGGVRVGFADGRTESYDLVVGADGLHSTVRRLVFGPQSEYERALGYRVAAFTVDGYLHRDEGVYVCHNVPGKLAARYTLRDNQAGFLLVHSLDKRRPVAEAEPSPAAAREAIRSLYSDGGWECAQILQAMQHSADFYCDEVSQTHVPQWSQGRVVLLGDACFCPSLLAGEGSSMAMAGAYVLAGELARAGGDYRSAFASYQHSYKAFTDSKQRATRSIGSFMVPRTAFGVWLRNRATALSTLPLIANWAVERMVQDHFELPSYEHG